MTSATAPRLPVVDLARRARSLEPQLSTAIARVLSSGQHLLGPETAAFEGEWATFCGSLHAVAVASGTDALRLTLTALGIGAGDEVVVPAFTAVPTAAAVCATGARPVFADIDPVTAALDVDAAAAAVSDRTKAVIPVHLYGRPAPIPDIGVPVIEDAAQAHGALGGLRPPSIAAAYSFYPTKNLGGVGDSGVVCTDDGDLASALRLLRAHGAREQYVHDVIATNSRMSEVEAAVLRVGLAALPGQTARRREIATAYREAAPWLAWHADHPHHVHHLCVLRVADRAGWRAARPFATAIHYPLALTEQPAYRHLGGAACPEAEAWAAECVSVPCFPEMTDAEVELVASGLSATS